MRNSILLVLTTAIFTGLGPVTFGFAKGGETKSSTAKAKKTAPATVKTSTAAFGQDLPTFAPPTSPITIPLILERFEAFDADMKSLTTAYRQTIRMDESGSVQEIAGVVNYAKPNKLRIEYRKPERQTLISDGQSLWVWRQETNQVIESNIEAWKKSEPLAQGLMDFGNYGAMLRRYDVSIATVSAAGKDGHRSVSLLLKPKEANGSFTLRLTLTTRDFFPATTELVTGQISITSQFEQVRFNPSFAPEVFQFTPPQGADIFKK